MISLVIAGRDDYGSARTRLQWWLFSALSSNVEVGDNAENDDDDGSDDEDDHDHDGDDDGVHVHLCQHHNMTNRQNHITAVKLPLTVLLILLSLLSSPCSAKISDKRLCYDEACSVVISKGKTVIPYSSKDHDVLSFPVNTDVKIYSKQAGNRIDLWGVEINGKRGYAPSKFIRELKILHTKLEYIVPTEESEHNQVNNIEENNERSDQIDLENISNNEKEDQKSMLSDALKKNFEETINPHQVSPSYESIYDGTLLPQENEQEPPVPSYSTQTLQPDIKEDEEVQLNVYPNLISSTFSSLSDLWNDIAEVTQEDNTENTPSEENINDEINIETDEINNVIKDDVNFESKNEVNYENILDIEKTNKSSFDSTEDKDSLLENVVLEDGIEGVSHNEILSQKENKIFSVNETDLLIQDGVNEKDLLVQNEVNEIDSLVQDKENKTDSLIQDDVNEKDSVIQKEPNENNLVIQEEPNENNLVIQEEPNENNLVIQDESNENDLVIQDEPNENDLVIQDEPNENDLVIEDEFNDNDLLIHEEPNENNLVIHEEPNENNLVMQDEPNENDLVIQNESNKNDLVLQDELNATDSLIQNEVNENDSQVQDELNETDLLIQDEVNKYNSSIQDFNEIVESKISINDNIIENINKIENQAVNVNLEEKLKSNGKVIDSTDFVNDEDAVNQSSFLQNESADKSSFVEKIQSIFEDLQNDIVPKQVETIDVTNNSLYNENHTNSIVDNDELRLIEQEVINATSINFVDVINSTISEVPLDQDIDEQLITSSHELSLPTEASSQKIFLDNENKDNFDISANITTHNSLIDKLNVDNSINSTTQFELNDNIVDSNKNETDNINHISEPSNLHNNSAVNNLESSIKLIDSNKKNIIDVPSTSSFGEFLGNRNLLNAKKESEELQIDTLLVDNNSEIVTSSETNENFSDENKQVEENFRLEKVPPINSIEKIVLPLETCDKDAGCFEENTKHQYKADENAVTNVRETAGGYDSLLYVLITALTTLLFSLGYYLIENRRRDSYLIYKINNLEKELMVVKKENVMLDENFKSTKAKLDSIEDQSFGSNEMVLSLKEELVASEHTRVELQDQIASLEKELESTSEAGLELECMLREILSSHSEENNPLAKSIEDLQDRLNNQQVANESLTNTLAIKTQENETLSKDLKNSLQKTEELEAEVSKLSSELNTQVNARNHLEQNLSDQMKKLEFKVNTLTEDKSHLRKKLRIKELEAKELKQVVEQMDTNNLDFEKFLEVSHIKAEAKHLVEDRDELKIKLADEEKARKLLEEHIKVISDEVNLLGEQCKVFEKEKKDAVTRLEVLTKFFEEKETQRQKEEAIWLEKQGEVSSTVDRLQTMQKEILNYKQQIEMLKSEILDQEREYKSQISVLETKAHEQWVAARQNERRLEEVKAESSQLRNRLTLVEKNMNDTDPDGKLHRLQTANGETHPLFAAPETSSSPLMFGASGPVPPPLPPGSFLYGPGSFAPPPPFLPLPPLAGSRPPPLGGGRLSSPPPGNSGSANNSSSNAGTDPSGNPGGALPLSPPPPLLPFPHHPLHRHRSPPPLPPFAADVPPPVPSGSLIHPHHLHRHMPPPAPPPLQPHQQESHQQQYPGGLHQPWSDEAPLPMRNSSGFHHQQRDQRTARNHKGSLHSSGESLDKSYYGGKS